VSRPASPIPPYEDEDEECIVVDDSDVNNDNEGNCPNLNEIMTKEELEMVAAIMEDLPPEVAELMMVDDDAGLNNNNNNNNLNEIPNEEEEEEEERAMVARIQLDLPELMLVDDNNNRVVSYEDLIASFVNG
jgi:hypothetical protein